MIDSDARLPGGRRRLLSRPPSRSPAVKIAAVKIAEVESPTAAHPQRG